MPLSRPPLLLCILYLVSSILSSSARAAVSTDKYWIGPTNGLWSDPNNWSLTPGGPGGAGAPTGGRLGTGDVAHVGAYSSQTIVFNPPNAAFAILNLASTGPGTTTLDVSQGGLTCDFESIGPGGIARQSGGNVTVFTSVSTFGAQSASSAYIMSGGLLQAQNIAFGDNTNVFQSSGSISSIANPLFVRGNAVYYLSGGGAGGEAFALQAPATLIMSGGGIGGYSGSIIGWPGGSGTATLYLRGGTVSAGDGRSSVYFAQSGSALVDQSGGLVQPSLHPNQGANVILADDSTSICNYNLSWGVISTDFLTVGNSGTAQLTMTGGSITANFALGINSRSHFTFKGGTLTTFTLSVAGAADLSPQASTKLAQYIQSPTGNLDLELDGNLPSQYASLSPTTSTSLAGQLTIDLSDTFSPELGDTFLLINTPSITGAFSSYNLPSLNDGLQWQPVYTPSSFSLSVVVPEPTSLILLAPLALLLRHRPQTRRRLPTLILIALTLCTPLLSFATDLSLRHPRTGKQMSWSLPLPRAFTPSPLVREGSRWGGKSPQTSCSHSPVGAFGSTP